MVIMGTYYSRNVHFEDEPATRTGADPEIFKKFETFDEPCRPVRAMAATTEEMDLAKLTRKDRDYCAHAYMQFMKCRRDWMPELYQHRCFDELQKLKQCQQDDHFHRKLEYERTKRLMLNSRKWRDHDGE